MRFPRHDDVPPPPEEWVPIPLGAGQEPNAYGHDGSFLYSDRADAGTTVDPLSCRRSNEPITFISRWPERW